MIYSALIGYVFGCINFAYITGKLCGRKIIRRRPFPRVSPNKSYEGIIGGIAVATVVMFGISLWQGHYGTAITFFHYAAVILVGWCTVCGDLLASLTKRMLCIKDSNACIHDHWLLKHPEKLMDGYGGYLDRLDSLFFAALVMGLIKCFDT